jgi:two-component system, NarL family, response regulator NreC
MQIRILIVDDHGVLRAGLRALLSLEDDLLVVGEASNGSDALELAGRLKPNVVILDISLPEMTGIEVSRRLKMTFPDINILLLTVHEETSLLREGIQSGANGYILKKAVEAELIEAIRQVAGGGMYVHPAMVRSLLEEQVPRTGKGPEVTLTQREIDVIRLLVKGYTNRQIAEEFSLSVRTIETHRSNIMKKLNLRSRLELVHYATRHKLG